MAKKPKKIRSKKKGQLERFIKKAKELGADESGETFERAFKRIVMAKRIGVKRK